MGERFPARARALARATARARARARARVGEAKGFGDKIKGKAHSAETKMDSEIVEARGDERADAQARRARGRRRAPQGGRGSARRGVRQGRAARLLRRGGFAHYRHSRPPTADERRAAKAARAARWRRSTTATGPSTKVVSVVPPGRLRGRAAVQAERATPQQGRDVRGRGVGGQAPQAGRQHAADDRVRRGHLRLDGRGHGAAGEHASGSSPRRGAHIDAKVASVHFGDQRPRRHPGRGAGEGRARVHARATAPRTFRGAALALDRELNLLDGTGARLLFVASDGHFVNGDDTAYADTFMPLAHAQGGRGDLPELHRAHGVRRRTARTVIDCRGKSPPQVAASCGKAAIKRDPQDGPAGLAPPDRGPAHSRIRHREVAGGRYVLSSPPEPALPPLPTTQRQQRQSRSR